MPCNGINGIIRLESCPTAFQGKVATCELHCSSCWPFTCWAEGAFGVWTLIQPFHSAGKREGCDPQDRTAHPRRGLHFGYPRHRWAASTFSTILYLDGKVRGSQTPVVRGRNCRAEWTAGPVEVCASARAARESASPPGREPGVLILEITEQQMGGRRSERRLVMEKK